MAAKAMCGAAAQASSVKRRGAWRPSKNGAARQANANNGIKWRHLWRKAA